MTSLINVFPDYPVARLDRDGNIDSQLTVMTPALAAASGFVAAHVAARVTGAGDGGVNVAVRGDFGTGKTHLLGFAARSLRDIAAGYKSPSSVVNVAAMETDPADWYRSAIGPAIARLGLEQLALTLYAEAAKTVAARAPMTQAAVAAVSEDPARARVLVESELLNPTAVELEFIALLEGTASDVSDSVRRALAGVVSAPRPSTRWLEGGSLSASEAAATGLTVNVSTDEQAADAIVGVAAMHARLRWPFLLVIDELEHFTRVDDTSGLTRNTTWLKRLLERLRRAGALVFVAGHLSAWEGRRDFVDRFTPGAEIDLSPLSGVEVMEILERHAGQRGAFTPDNATLVSELANGNVRRVLALLRELFDRSAGFAVALSQDDIRSAAAALQERVDPERAVDSVAVLLADLGLRVARSTLAFGTAFDMVAYQDATPAVVVEVRHATFGAKQQDQATVFLDKMRSISVAAPNCVGIFLSQGALDTGLRELDPSLARVLWFDMTRRDFLDQLRSALTATLVQASSAPGGSSAPERDAALASLQDTIRVLQESQAQMYDELFQRLNTARPPEVPSVAAAAPQPSVSFQPPARDDVRDRTRTIYEELSRPPSRARRFGYMYGRTGLIGLFAVIAGAGLMIGSSSFANGITRADSSNSAIQAIFLFAGLLIVVIGAFFLLLAYLVVERFFTFKQERLRDAYLQDWAAEDLIHLNREIENALARYGPRYARAELEGFGPTTAASAVGYPSPAS